jgi:hypothetical protein
VEGTRIIHKILGGRKRSGKNIKRPSFLRFFTILLNSGQRLQVDHNFFRHYLCKFLIAKNPATRSELWQLLEPFKEGTMECIRGERELGDDIQ